MRRSGVNASLRSGFRHSLQNSQLPARRHRDAANFFFGDLRERIEVANRLQLIAEEFQSHWPRAGEWEHVENAATQGNLSFAADLGLGFITLLFEPFDQVQRIKLLATPQG